MPYLYFQPKVTPRTRIQWAPPPSSTHQKIIALLKHCSEIEELNQIHSQMIRTGLIQDTLLASQIIAFFTIPSAHFDVDYAQRIFDQVLHPNVFMWNSMIRGYTQNHAPKKALILYKQMLGRAFSPDNYTFPIVTKVCSHLRVLELGEMLHGQILKCGFESDMFIMSGIVNFYASCARIEVARKLFDEMPERDVVSWTTMVSGYAQSNHPEEAFLLFNEMRMEGVEPNKVTVMSLLSACGQLQALDRGQWIHSYILENNIECDMHVKNSLMNMYAKCGSMSTAVRIFRNMPTRNTVSWNVLISGYAQSGCSIEALALFREMEGSDIRPNEITMVSTLLACAQLGDLRKGKLLHAYIKERMIDCDIFVGNALINMYAKCGGLEEATRVFHEMPARDVFSWTAMITGYVHGSWFKEALALFQEMQLLRVEPNEVTLVGLLSACSQLGALDQGKWIHTYIEGNNVKQDVCLGNALVDMYAKCGCIKTALRVFHSMPHRDTFSWNAIIGSLAMHGHGREALDLFSQMQRMGDMRPDGVTLLAVLSACTHSGMVHEGYSYFNSMSSLYGITPRIEHYGCMVDLLSRAGLVEEANDFIEKMPLEPNPVIWGSLLAACRVHCKASLGEKVARRILELAPDDEGAHILLSNIYAEAGRWDDVREVRTLMGDRGIEKSPGFSSIEVDGIVREFFVGDVLVHEHDQIYLVLDGLTLQLKQAIHETSPSFISW
ncbi:pentatricopeptide repeat-containing protein At3g22690-like [Magnolia sinica]|uniref:pentatricopeptide repeat-containing protein At3g22690-like n=1 Tax=Magnolia sinica TaxID=86752 RepID=UPI00265A7019|nr:pentatricopeptide repeat-containing protein At3g22690-like [Magnolia sinica]